MGVCTSVPMRAHQWPCLPVIETCGNPVSNRAVPREVEKEMLPLSQLPNQKCPRGSCTLALADSQLYFSSSQPRDEGPRKVGTAGSVK